MTYRFANQILMCSSRAVLVLALALAVFACGGQSLEESCSSICKKITDCVNNTDPASLEECETNCTNDGESAAACESAVYDVDDCIQDAECADFLNGTVCTDEISALEAACPNA